MTSEPQTNEHQDDDRYEDCFVAFLDILGFKNKVLGIQKDPAILENIIQSLDIINRIPSGPKVVSVGPYGVRRVQIRRRFFSDSLVFFLKEKPSDIAQLFFVIRYLQDQLWKRGICLRGSIVRGKMYWTEEDNNITVGQGLIDAHLCESTIAIYPRIVVSEELYAYIERESPCAFPLGKSTTALLVDCIAKDADGLHFLDLLHPDVNRARGEALWREGSGGFSIAFDSASPSRHPDVLGFVDQIIQDNTGATNAKARQKYAWLQTYRSRYDGGNPGT